jgi:hypothetical protein
MLTYAPSGGGAGNAARPDGRTPVAHPAKEQAFGWRREEEPQGAAPREAKLEPV